MSNWHHVTSGVPQGSVLGPILFVIFINTLVEQINHSELFLFADDNKLFKIISSEYDALQLQDNISSKYNWSLKSLLKFHPDKCFSMSIKSNKESQVSQSYQMNGKTLEKKRELKDLGVLIDDQLKFSNHISEKVNKANQTMGLIRRSFNHLDTTKFKLLYKRLVRPHVEYAYII